MIHALSQSGQMPEQSAQAGPDRYRAKIKNIATGRLFAYLILFVLGLQMPQTVADPSDDLPDFGDSAGAIISPAQEKKLCESFMRQVRRYAPVVDDEEVEEPDAKMARRVDANSDIDE